MIQRSAHLVAKGGWGENSPPPFGFNLSGAALMANAKTEGIARYGPKPASALDDDSRPIGLAYQGIASSNANFGALNGGPQLRVVEQENGRLFSQTNVSFDDVTPRQWSGGNVGADGALSLDLFLHPRGGESNAVITSWRWGVTGAGGLFQVREGRAEFGFLSKEWNEDDYQALVLMWQLSQPDPAQSALEEKLFDGFGSLGGDWISLAKRVVIVPEPRGVAHVIASGETTSIQCSSRIEDLPRIAQAEESLPLLWEAGPITLLTTGQVFHFSLGVPQLVDEGKLIFGPFKTGLFVEHLGDLRYALNCSRLDEEDVTIERFDVSDSPFFYFHVTLKKMANGGSPWLYGISARLKPGPRNGSDEVSFDSDDLYTDLNGFGETDPIMEIEPRWEGGSRGTTQRGATVTLRDVLGRTTTYGGSTTTLPRERVASLMVNGAEFLTNALVTGVKQTNVAAFSRGVPTVDSGFDFKPRAETDLVITLSDGWAILNEKLCEAPPTGDGLYLGGYLRALLELAGFKDAELAGVGASEGPRVPRAAVGDGFAVQVHPDTPIASAINAALDVRGLGYTFFQDRFGVWQLKKPASGVVREFDGVDAVGRNKILQPLDIVHDTQDFFNDFLVRGGRNGEIEKSYTFWESIRQPSHADYIGRKKSYTPVVDSSLLTLYEVEYALRSLVWRHGRAGRRAQFESYFHQDLEIGDRLRLDGGLWEYLAPSGGSWSRDEMQFYCLEVT